MKGGDATEIVASIEFPSSSSNKKKKLIVSRQSLKTLRQRWMVPNSGFCWLNDEVNPTGYVAAVVMALNFNNVTTQVVNLYTALIARHSASMNTTAVGEVIIATK